MPKRTCTAASCDRPQNARGYCRAHYHRWLKTGDIREDVPLRKLPSRSQDIVSRILEQTVTLPNGCMEFQGHKTAGGYGVTCWNGRTRVAHRVMWTVLIGPIPTDDDWTVDHLCRNRACVNVKHMEIVTRIENTRRGGGLRKAQHHNIITPKCKNGHDYPDGYVPRNENGHRICQVCRAAKVTNRSANWAAQKDRMNRLRREAYRKRRDAGLDPLAARIGGIKPQVE